MLSNRDVFEKSIKKNSVKKVKITQELFWEGYFEDVMANGFEVLEDWQQRLETAHDEDYIHQELKRRFFYEQSSKPRVRCEAPDCTSRAVSGGLKGYCKAYGGGTRCQAHGCTKLAASGGEKKGYCFVHGGGTRY
jgi:hypothetical protein